MRWENRYSSTEMVYLDLTENEVRSYLNDALESGYTWSFASVLAGEADSTVTTDFGLDVLNELKAAVEAKVQQQRPPETLGL